MKMEKLTNEQQKEAREWLRYYNFVNICSKCKTMYGSDLKEPIKICPKCHYKLYGKRKK